MVKLDQRGPVVIETGTIVASGSYTSEAFSTIGLQGFFSLQWNVTGDGTMKAEVIVSNDGTTFIEVDSDITTSQTKSTGTSGNNIIDFEVTPCEQFKIKITETGGASSITVVARLRAV